MRKVIQDVRKWEIENCVRVYQKCQSIDRAQVRTKRGKLQVNKYWERIVLDVTHNKGKAYLSVVDYGTGRITIWKHLNRESALEIIKELEEII